MPSISLIRQKANLIPDDEMRQVCIQIIDEVSSRITRSNQGLWTIDVISKWVGRSPEDEVLNRVVQLLVGRKDAQLLDMHFIYFSPFVDDGIGEKVDDGEVAEAIKTGFLVDPVTGEAVDNFKELLFPYFEPVGGLES